jgi:hypothetical protein
MAWRWYRYEPRTGPGLHLPRICRSYAYLVVIPMGIVLIIFRLYEHHIDSFFQVIWRGMAPKAGNAEYCRADV